VSGPRSELGTGTRKLPSVAAVLGCFIVILGEMSLCGGVMWRTASKVFCKYSCANTRHKCFFSQDFTLKISLLKFVRKHHFYKDLRHTSRTVMSGPLHTPDIC
jgi:hypothetical protein